MKKILKLLLLSLLVASCNTLEIADLNKEFIRKKEPISQWDKDLLDARIEILKQLDLGSSKDLYLIELYDYEYGFYYGTLVVNKDKYFHFEREGYNSEIVFVKNELTNTEKFILNKIEANKLNEIMSKSKDYGVMSPSQLYITIANKNANKKVKMITCRYFYLD